MDYELFNLLAGHAACNIFFKAVYTIREEVYDDTEFSRPTEGESEKIRYNMMEDAYAKYSYY